MGEAIVYTFDEVAEMLAISKSTAYRLASTGKIPSIKFGTTVRVPKAAFDAWLEQKTGEAE